MSTLWLVLGGVVIALLSIARATSVLVDWRVEETSPRGVARRLRATGRHTVRFDRQRFTWNPALPTGPDNRLPGPGVASYSLDGEGVVQLSFRADSGEVQHFAGPLPQLARALDPKPSVAALVAAPTLALIGFLTSFAASNGADVHRVAVGVWVGIAGWVVGSVAQMTVGMVVRTRAFAAQTR